MDSKERILKIAQEEFPGSTVAFDAQADKMIRFRIEDRAGHILSKGFPHYRPSEIEDWTDDKLRAIVRGLCGQFLHTCC